MNKLKTCNLCESTNIELVDAVHDLNRGFEGDFNLYRCKNCELMFLHPQLSYQEIMKYYTDDYYQKIGEGTGIQKIIRKFVRFLQKLYIKNPNIAKLFFLFSQYIRGTKMIPNGRYLDVGCGNGAFLDTIKKMNPSGEYYGLEPGEFDKEDIEAHKLNVQKKTLEEAHYPDNSFDQITLNHVFEHIADPSVTMKELKRILKPGGILIVAVPNTNSLAYKIFGKFFHQLDAPRHFFHYSDKNLKQYASKFGFKGIKTRYGAFRDQTSFIVSIFHIISTIFGKNIWLKFNEQMAKGNILIIMIFVFLYLLFTPLTIILNLIKFGDSVEVWMKKQ